MVQPKTIAIVVTYNPERERLKQALAALAPQVAKILIVDNGSTEPISGLRHAVSETEIEVIPLGDNRGIATAQNVGIERARAEGADYVALFDQDSIAPADLIAVLMSFAEAKRAQGEAIAAIGPNFRDLRLNKEARLLRTIGRHTKTQSRADGAVVPVDHLIASGSLIPMEALDQVGLMRDELFIDYVDIEWCMRAEHRFGRISYATFDAVLEHELGSHPVRFFGTNFAIHSPMRHYYLFRNSIWMWTRSWIPLDWKLARAPGLIKRLGFCVVFGRPVLQQWRMILHGLWDGMTGRMGKFGAR